MKDMSEIKRNIRAVDETRQITNAMYLLATSMTKKSMTQINYNQIYMRRIRAVVKDILEKTSGLKHIYLDKRPVEKELFFVATSDKSLCGSYNFNISDFLKSTIESCVNPVIETTGICGSHILAERGFEIENEWYNSARQPTVSGSRQLGEYLINLYTEGKVSEVNIIYTHYYSQTNQKPVCIKLLPLNTDDFTDVEEEYKYRADMIYEPSKSDVFDMLVPQYIIGFVYGTLYQALLCENIARMNAMQSSTKNADSMLKKLNFEFNSARQLSITNEITEIAAASEIIENRSV